MKPTTGRARGLLFCVLATWAALLTPDAACEDLRARAEAVRNAIAGRKEQILALQRESKFAQERPTASLSGPLEAFLSDCSDTRALDVLVDRLVSHSRFRDGVKFGKELVDDVLVVDCLVEALSYPKGAVQRAASKHLWLRARPTFLRARTQRLVSAYETHQDVCLLRAIGRTDTVEARRLVDALVARGRDVPEEVQARCGNKAMEKRILEQFLEETDPRKKGELALKVGYIGTAACVLALAREMRNPMVVEQEGQEIYSVRYMVLKGLGLALPDESLFGNELQLVVSRTVCHLDVAAREKSAGDYIERAERWSEQWFGIEWGRPRPPFLLARIVFKY